MLSKFTPNIFRLSFWRELGQDFYLLWYMLRDLIPGFIPFIGQLADITLLMLALRLFVWLAPDKVVEDYKQKTRPEASLLAQER